MRQSLLTATRMTSLMAFPAFMGMAVVAPAIGTLTIGFMVWVAKRAIESSFRTCGLLERV